MKAMGFDGIGNRSFHGEISCRVTGNYGFTTRVLPSSLKLELPYTASLIIWAEEQVVVSAKEECFSCMDSESLPQNICLTKYSLLMEAYSLMGGRPRDSLANSTTLS